MPVRLLSDAELARLSGWPHDVADDDLVTFFTLTSDDLGWLGSNVRIDNRLGAAVQLCTLPWLGWIPDDLNGCPSAAVDRLASRLGLAGADVPGLLAAYGGWERRTRRDHRALVLGRLAVSFVRSLHTGDEAVTRAIVTSVESGAEGTRLASSA